MNRVSKIIFVGLAILPVTAGVAFAETVKVSLEDNAIKLDHASVKQGKITFEVVNDSMTEKQEMVVVSKPAGEMPYDAKTKRVIEKKVKSFGEVADLKSGAKGKLTVALKAGDYVLICNIPGHYMDGMRVDFTVTP
jgi:uncharacterized cupredoxin-like copper-binding protein